MRINLTTLLLIIGLVQVTAKGFGQISLNEKNAPLKSVFKNIETQTGFVFFSNDFDLESARVTVILENATIEDALDKCLKHLPLTYKIIDRTIVVSKKRKDITEPPARAIDLKGKVTDETGGPLPGVSIRVENTTKGTITGGDGNYALSGLNATDVLIFSFIGYKNDTVRVGNRTEINVQMVRLAGQTLDEVVVVVGMNIRQTKRSVTGAMATIQTKELKQSPVANLNNALAGRLPGLITVQSSGQPGEDAAAMYIRGIATYGSNTAPLIVIDGLPRGQGSFSQIDPNEVESVSILKDASSSALYGIQGANGVVVVTTKRGKAKEKPAIDFTAQQAVQQVIRLPKPMNTYESALYFNDYDTNNGISPRFGEEALETVRTGSDKYLYPDVNWFDEVLRNTARQSQYNINISGGTDNKVKYFVSGSYINQGSLLKFEDIFDEKYGQTSDFDRYNFRSNIDIQATKHLQLQVDLAGRLEKRTGPMPGFGELFSTISNIPSFALPVFNPDGTLGAASNVEIPYWRNPYGLATQAGYYVNSTNVMYGTISAKHDLDFWVKGLSAQMFFSFENNNYKATQRSQEFDSYWYRGLDIDGLPIYQQTKIESTLSTTGTNNIEQSNYLDFRLNYSKKIAEHSLTAQILGNRTLRTFDHDLSYAYQGVSGRFTYNYKQKYFLEANLGYNGSENFPKGRRYGFFPSGSLGWIVSDENFMADVNTIKYLKLRGSYGVVGNDKIGSQRWLYQSDFSAGGGYTFGMNPTWQRGFNESRVGNPFVTWERSTKANIGFEISLFKSEVVQLNFDVFHERRINILTTPGTVPDYLGINGLAPLNTGIVENKGFDGELRINKKWKDFSFFTNVQLTYAKNKVIQNDQPIPAYGYQNLMGYEVGYVLGYKAIGFFSSVEDIQNSAKQSFDNKVIPGDIKYFDVNSDGVIDDFDRVPVQIQNVPRFMGGFSIGGTYKNFDVSLLLNGASGGTADYVPRAQDRILLQRWTPENQANAKVPVAKMSSNNSLRSDFYIFSTDYLKLRNAEIGYTFPASWLKPIKISYARMFVNGQNLAIWDKLWIKDRDPESSGSWNAPYPLQRVFNLGLNIRL